MAIKNSQRGFTLLIAVIFMSVMLAFGLALGSLSYKQQVLASSAIESQYAFYAADAALECALRADQSSENIFAHPPSDPGVAPTVSCDGSGPISSSYQWVSDRWSVTNRLQLDSDKRCADITVYKPDNGVAYIFSQGYDVSCATLASPETGARIVTRGINVQYSVGN